MLAGGANIEATDKVRRREMAHILTLALFGSSFQFSLFVSPFSNLGWEWYLRMMGSGLVSVLISFYAIVVYSIRHFPFSAIMTLLNVR